MLEGVLLVLEEVLCLRSHQVLIKRLERLRSLNTLLNQENLLQKYVGKRRNLTWNLTQCREYN